MSEDREDELIRRVTAALRERGAASPGFDTRLMAAIRRPRPSALRTLWTWLKEPQPLALSPIGMTAGAAAVAALLAATALIAPRVGERAAPAGSVASVAGASQIVRFVYAAPGARSVSLVGTFNAWDPDATPLRRTDRTGIWIVDLPLPPGRHEYGFLIDGREWQPDPAAPPASSNEYGLPNSVLLVTPRHS